jgi:adenine-specific DNA-methyltransferase
MRDAHFQAALFDAKAPIVQRRSGKAKPVSAASGFLPLAAVPIGESGSPAEILASGKLMARGLASVLPDDVRLALARRFAGAVIAAYWAELQSGWPLAEGCPAGSLELEEPAASLANTLGAAAARLGPIEASYLIGILYTAMLPDDTRSKLGVYYTPPGLTARLLDRAAAAGVDWSTCRVLDPACGGGAFLAPVAARMVKSGGASSARQLVRAIGERLRGFEIDPFAAWCSQVFLEATTLEVCREAGERLPPLVEVCNSLLRPAAAAEFDLVVGNPPYGRVTLSPAMRSRYRRSLYGHANLYGLFTDLAVQLTRPGGVIAYVTPTSFLSGEYFKKLRQLLSHEAPPASIDFVSLREGVFDDVLQETLLAAYRRSGSQRRPEATVHFLVPAAYDRIEVAAAGRFTMLSPGGGPWLMPRSREQRPLIARLRAMPHRLRDYGYEVSTGPLVWNRHKSQLASRPVKGALPLIWAESVTADGRFVFRADKKNHQPYFVPRRGDEWLISRSSCVLLQRTTAKEQSRRLIAAELPPSFLAERGAVVIENHLNMIRPVNGTPAVPPRVLTALLNSETVDRAFRCISGSVAVSAYELEALPLPAPEQLGPLMDSIAIGAAPAEIERACSRLFGANG